jgi:hypothetical protein
MRNLLSLVIFLTICVGLVGLPACDDSGNSGSGTGTLVADIDIEGYELLASASPLQKLCEIFQPRSANALADLGFQGNDYPFNHITGPKTAQGGLEVMVVSLSHVLLDEGTTSDSGRVSFNDIDSGYVYMVIVGKDGNSYQVPVEVSENTTSRTRVLVYKSPSTGKPSINSKTIHDQNDDGINDDSFSFSMFGRSPNKATGGVVYLHEGNETRIDVDGDGSFTGDEDKLVIEPDDDGRASDKGDGDEDNDGILDNVDTDIDGDGILNDSDPDIDGDGILNASDPFPNGITPFDDFTPPGLAGSLGYTGVKEVAPIDSTSVSVFFPEAVEEKNPPVTYLIYYSTTTPIDFATAAYEMFVPSGAAPDGVFSDNVTGLIASQTYYIAVRARDHAQPPNTDTNTNEIKVTVGS